MDNKLASQIVWLDCLLTNVDRTVRNTNMLMWHKELWLIDHGASLYFHHSWESWEEHSIRHFAQIKNHVLLKKATELEAVDSEFRKILNENVLQSVVALIPETWLLNDGFPGSPDGTRSVYYQFLVRRLASFSNILNHLADVRISDI